MPIDLIQNANSIQTAQLEGAMFRNFVLGGSLFATACVATVADQAPAGEASDVSVQQQDLSLDNELCGKRNYLRAEATVRDTTLNGKAKRKTVGDASSPFNNIYIEANAKPSGGLFIGDTDRNEVAICNTNDSGLCIEGGVTAVAHCHPGGYDTAGGWYPDPGDVGWDWTYVASIGVVAPGECYRYWHYCPAADTRLEGWASTKVRIDTWSAWLGD